MLNKLIIRGTFKHPNTTIDFTTGFSAIKGRNESGKTMILEMVGYSLFGSKMLRGKAPDYADLHTELDFTVNGEVYKVVRSRTKSQLFRGEVLTVTGVKELNAAIIKVLGFNEKVFLIANYAQQNQVTALSDMKPTERKKMVDSTIGMDIITEVEQEISLRASVVREQLKAIGELPDSPTEPELPLGYVGIEATKNDEVELERLQVLKSEKDKLEGQLCNPTHNPGVFTLQTFHGDLELKNNQLNSLVSSVAALKLKLEKAASTPPISKAELTFELSEWDSYTQYLQQEAGFADLKHFVPSEYCHKVLDECETACILWNKYKAAEAYYLEQSATTCPACDHTWKSVEAPVLPEVAKPLLNIQGIENARNKLIFAENHKDRLEEYAYFLANTTPKTAPSLPRTDIQKLLDIWQLCEKFEELKLEVDIKNREIKTLEGIPMQVEAKRIYERDKNNYDAKLETYQLWVVRKDSIELRVAEIGAVEETVAAIKLRLPVFRNYETLKLIFDRELTAWFKLIDYHGELFERQKQYTLVSKALKELRVKIKEYLVPSLNKVASHLLSQMTGGDRNYIFIDPEFEITVDGQPIGTLSGSGKAIANLAIRIALGQVLINKKFSVFMGDEIDGDMDIERATWTAECLRNLSKNISQLILISHKDIEADNYIIL